MYIFKRFSYSSALDWTQNNFGKFWPPRRSVSSFTQIQVYNFTRSSTKASTKLPQNRTEAATRSSTKYSSKLQQNRHFSNFQQNLHCYCNRNRFPQILARIEGRTLRQSRQSITECKIFVSEQCRFANSTRQFIYFLWRQNFNFLVCATFGNLSPLHRDGTPTQRQKTRSTPSTIDKRRSTQDHQQTAALHCDTTEISIARKITS